MVKPSMPMMARLRLTTKHTRGGYYKGNRSGSMGSFVQPSSKYEVDWNKARTYVVPTESMETFKVRSSNQIVLWSQLTRCEAHALCHETHGAEAEPILEGC
jgi:hypothetical protein